MQIKDIILIKFPFTDLSDSKLRPVLVLAQPDSKQDLIVCAISSQFNEYAIIFNEIDLDSGNLPMTSYICYHKLITISKKLAVKKVATLGDSKLTEVKKALVGFTG